MVLVADEITPSVIAQLDWSMLAALVTDAGSWTYHTAILARSLRIPAVAGLHNASAVIPPGANVAVDGSTGEVIVDPDEQALAQVAARRRRREAYEQSLDEFRPLPAVTEDGVAIRLEANIEAPDDAGRARERGAEGIGLFRSEFLLAGGGQGALAEESQYAAYRRLIEGAGRPARDRAHLRRQRAAAADRARRRRRARGRRSDCAASGSAWRSTRSSRRSSARCCAPRAHGPLRIMFPFVSGVDELRAARAAVRAGRRDAARRAALPVPDSPDRRHDRSAVGGAHRRSARARKPTSSASAPTI